MPNHVINEVIFKGLTTSQIEMLKSLVLNRDGVVDFEVLLPPPLNSWPFSAGSRHKVFPDNHLDWCGKNWSTKWNAYGEPEAITTDDSLTLIFRTAWRTPYGWLLAIFNKTMISFSYNSFSEGEDAPRLGIFDAAEIRKDFGTPWNETMIEDISERRRLHKLLWGIEEFEPE